MHVLVVYAHPSEESFTRQVRDRLLEGLTDGGHSWERSDLYAMGFRTDMTGEEYQREAHYRDDLPVPKDVWAEQEKLRRCRGVVFVYPVFWTEAPAKLVGWFDRVWTYGFAYGERTMPRLERALFLCVAGNTLARLREFGHVAAMETVMLGDRMFDRVCRKELVVLDGMSRHDRALREKNRERHLAAVYRLGRMFGEESGQ